MPLITVPNYGSIYIYKKGVFVTLFWVTIFKTFIHLFLLRYANILLANIGHQHCIIHAVDEHTNRGAPFLRKAAFKYNVFIIS